MRIFNLGLRPYKEVLNLQYQYRDEVRFGKEEVILLCSHPPVVTLGKQSTPEDLHGWNGETQSIERGGKATYHGPGQIIAYPILNLEKRNRDIGRYVRTLELAMVKCLEEFGLHSQGQIDGTEKTTGVWVQGKKVASIGIAIQRWITYHGLAMNLNPDPLAFQGIRPCGFTPSVMSSAEEILGKTLSRTLVEERLLHHLQLLLTVSE